MFLESVCEGTGGEVLSVWGDLSRLHEDRGWRGAFSNGCGLSGKKLGKGHREWEEPARRAQVDCSRGGRHCARPGLGE